VSLPNEPEVPETRHPNAEQAPRERGDDLLRASDRRIENILESITNHFVAVDRQWRYTYINERALANVQRAKGQQLTRDEILGKNMWEIFPEAVGSVFYEKYHEALREHKTVHFEAYSPLSERWVEQHVYPSEEGLTIHYQDITERKRTEEELKESEERFRAFFETAAVGAAQADPTTGRFLQVNEKLCRFLGYGREELLSMTFSDVTHPDDRAHDLEGISHLLRGETHEYTTEKRYVRKDGQTVWGQVAVSLVRDAAGRALQAIAVTQDISARKAAEEALLEIREAERRRIARDLHDVVLQDLAGVLQGLQATQVESEVSTHATDLRPEIEALRTAVGSLRNAIYDLRLEGKQTFVRGVESLVELNRQLAPEREITLAVQIGFPPDLPDGRDVEVLRVLREALANIRRHSDARRVEVVLSNGRDRARLEVTDDGRGFDAASIRAGVGLSGMHERASEIGGELTVESGPGKGTRVMVEFPL